MSSTGKVSHPSVGDSYNQFGFPKGKTPKKIEKKPHWTIYSPNAPKTVRNTNNVWDTAAASNSHGAPAARHI